MHEHNAHCGCKAHTHEGHSTDPDHVHGEHCGCGHEHLPVPTPEGLTPVQVDILLALRQRQYLPVACFSLAKTEDDARHGIALAPVYLSSAEDTMAQVKQLGAELKQLEETDLISLDYDLPLQGYAYTEYHTSALYAYFVQTVAEAAALPNPTFDTPVLELGSMALTENGDAMVDSLLK